MSFCILLPAGCEKILVRLLHVHCCVHCGPAAACRRLLACCSSCWAVLNCVYKGAECATAPTPACSRPPAGHSCRQMETAGCMIGVWGILAAVQQQLAHDLAAAESIRVVFGSMPPLHTA